MYWLLRLCGLYSRGERNARNFQIREIEFAFKDLPAAFDGYTILHLSDLHGDQLAGLMAAAAVRLAPLKPHMVIVTGDIQSYGAPIATVAADEISALVSAIDCPDGWVATLGNHDSGDMVEALESLGVRTLVNESVLISRSGETLCLVGLDDVHSFYTPQAPAALDRHREGFRIALVHTVELATHAARAGYDLYLSGHSHGGQICLPDGKPLMTALDSHRHLAAGRWRLQEMQGYTSRGLGAKFPTVRFNCPGEAVMISLRRLPD